MTTAPHLGRCVIIPSYNSGRLLQETVRSVMAVWPLVVVVIDGSTDASERPVLEWAQTEPALHVIQLNENSGKGAAVLAGLEWAHQRGWTHAAVFDADGQHEAADLPRFMDASRLYPEAMILGLPVFGPDAPTIRVLGRRLGNWLTHLETLWGGIGDSLFGFRVYPVESSLRIMHNINGAREFDFDTQLVVRLFWSGVPPLNLPTPVSYRTAQAGGVTHFNYFRDNLLLTAVHTRLILLALLQLPRLVRLRLRPRLTVPSGLNQPKFRELS
jgi:hypothetical protein